MIDTAIIPTLTCLDKLGQSHRRVDYTEDNDDKHPFTNTLILCYFDALRGRVPSAFRLYALGAIVKGAR